MRILALVLFILLALLWLAAVIFRRRCAGWGFALWFPFAALSVGAAVVNVVVWRDVAGPETGEELAKFMSTLVAYITLPAWFVLLISILRYPPRAADYRPASLLTGIGLLLAFLACAYGRFSA